MLFSEIGVKIVDINDISNYLKSKLNISRENIPYSRTTGPIFMWFSIFDREYSKSQLANEADFYAFKIRCWIRKTGLGSLLTSCRNRKVGFLFQKPITNSTKYETSEQANSQQTKHSNNKHTFSQLKTIQNF